MAPTATETAVTFSGTVTNIVTGALAGGATVTIGSTSTTTGSDGSYSLAVTAAGQPAFSAAAPGYYTRESQVWMTGSTTINPEIIPQGDGFDLAFFDDSFRDGAKGTQRWGSQPTVEIWAQQLRCVDPCTSSQLEEVTADAVPASFEHYAREAIASMSDLSDGVMTNPVITMKSFTVGTQLSQHEVSNNIRFKYIKVFSPPYETDGGATTGRENSKNEIVDASISINGSVTFNSDGAIFRHEFAHAMGFNHPRGVPNVIGPSIMGPDPVRVTAKDRLHANILYERPAENVSPDRDPPGVTIN